VLTERKQKFAFALIARVVALCTMEDKRNITRSGLCTALRRIARWFYCKGR